MSNPPTTTPAVNVPTIVLCALVSAAIGGVWWWLARRDAAATTTPTQQRDWIESIATLAIITGAGCASFHGLRHLVTAGGFPWWVANTIPMLLDGAALVTARSWRDRALPASTRQHAGRIAVGLLAGSILGNIGDVLGLGVTVGVRIAVGAIPPLVLGLALHLQRQVRTDREELARTRTAYRTAAEYAAGEAEQLRQAEKDEKRLERALARVDELRAAGRAALAERRRELEETAAREHAEREREESEARADRDRRIEEALAAERFEMETAAYAEHHRRQADASAAAEEDARRRECNARDERARLAAEHQAATPARTPARKRGGNTRSRQRGRQPEPLADLVARARPILAADDLGRPALAERLGCTQDRARKVLEAINGEQSDASPDPLEEAWSAPASDAPEHTVSGHPVSATAGGEQ